MNHESRDHNQLNRLLVEYKVMGYGYRLASEKYNCISSGLRIPNDICIALLTAIGTYSMIKELSYFDYIVTGISIISIIFRTLSVGLSYETKRDEFIKAAEYYENKVAKVTEYINSIPPTDTETIKSKVDKLNSTEFDAPLLPTSFEKEARDYIIKTV